MKTETDSTCAYRKSKEMGRIERLIVSVLLRSEAKMRGAQLVEVTDRQLQVTGVVEYL